MLFRDFGDNTLTFELYFWLSMQRMMELRTIASDIRFRLDELFGQGQIVIAFPQRDVHLDTRLPLEVKLIDSPDKPTRV